VFWTNARSDDEGFGIPGNRKDGKGAYAMKMEQISIFLENRPGGLEQVTGILKEAGINIRTLTLADTSDYGILRMIVNDVDKTSSVLKEKGFRVSRTSVVAVEVPDRPGGLHLILEVLANNGINVEYLYAFVERSGENAVMIFRFDAPDRAIEALEKSGLTVLPGSKLYGL
jgi:hypothetical protein